MILSTDDAHDAGLFDEYRREDPPEGSWVGVLERRAWGKSSNLWCCFRNAETGERIALSAFGRAGVYAPKGSAVNFAADDMPELQAFHLVTGTNGKGGPAWLGATPMG